MMRMLSSSLLLHRLTAVVSLLLLCIVVVVTAENPQENNLELVKISIQPAYHAIPIFAARKYGWFEELGIQVRLSVWASGAPQVRAAVEEDAWEFGIAGSVPNVIAGRQGILTVGINNDESYANELIGKPGVEEWPPTLLTPGVFAATPKSVGELLLRKCLVAANVTFSNEHVFLDQQGPLITKLGQEGVDPRYACFWAPNTYAFREKHPSSQIFCSGRDIDFPIYGGLMMRAEWAERNVDLAKRTLAAYLRGVSFMQNPKLIDQVIRVSDEYHRWSGDPISTTALQEDLELRPLFNLEQQLVHLNRNISNRYISHADEHYIELEEFLLQQGVIDEQLDPHEYVVDTYMKLVSEDDELRAFAYYTAADAVQDGLLLPGGSEDGESSSSAGFGTVGSMLVIMAAAMMSTAVVGAFCN